jgi:hypothetical protein
MIFMKRQLSFSNNILCFSENLGFAVLLILGLFFSSPNITAQNNHEDWSAVIEGSLTFGGNMSRNTLVYRTGPYITASLVKTLYPQLQWGGGFGLLAFQKESFIPVFTNFRLWMNPNPKGFYFEMKAGWSLGTNPAVEQISGNTYRGGLFVQPTFGYRIPIYTFSTQFGLQLVSQQARHQFKNSEIQYTEFISFHTLGIFFGIEF